MKKAHITIGIFAALLFILGIGHASAITCTNTFPASLNQYSPSECIPSAWANALEAKLGIDHSASTTSLDYLINNLFTSYHSDIIKATSTQGLLQTLNNLSDLTNLVSARANLGLGTAATHPASDFLASSTIVNTPSTTIPTVYVSSVNGLSGALTGIATSSGVSAGSCTNCNVTFNGNGAATVFTNGSGGGGGSGSLASTTPWAIGDLVIVSSTNLVTAYPGSSCAMGMAFTGLSATGTPTCSTFATSTSGGAGSSVLLEENAIGTVDGSNTVFTLSHTPIFISVSGQTMISGNGYTYSVPTATFSFAPLQTPHSFYTASGNGVAGLSTDVLYNESGVQSATSTFTFTSSTQTLAVPNIKLNSSSAVFFYPISVSGATTTVIQDATTSDSTLSSSSIMLKAMTNNVTGTYTFSTSIKTANGAVATVAQLYVGGIYSGQTVSTTATTFSRLYFPTPIAINASTAVQLYLNTMDTGGNITASVNSFQSIGQYGIGFIIGSITYAFNTILAVGTYPTIPSSTYTITLN